MSTHYSKIISYIIEDLKLKNFDFQTIINELKTKMSDENKYVWNEIEEIIIVFKIISPDFQRINHFYDQKAIKSHELLALIEKVREMIKNAVTHLVSRIDYTINLYLPFKNNISIQRSEKFIKYKEMKISKRIDDVLMGFNPRKLELYDILACVKLWNLEELAFAEELSIKVYIRHKGKVRYNQIINLCLEKKKLNQISNFLTTSDVELTNELLGHPNYYKILKNYIFQENFQNQSEITLDVARNGQLPQKRRTISINGLKMKIHEALTPHTPHQQFYKIIKQNKIVGFYCSVKSTTNKLLYLLIDIDVPSIFLNLFPQQQVWELILNITKAIQRTAYRFGLPSFKISFSGARGVHLLYSVKPYSITDVEKHINLPELSDQGVIPGIKTIKKEKISSLNDKFKFAKSILQSLLLYTVYKGSIDIPREIKYKLGITHPSQLFRLSPDSKNLIAILLDCSSQGRGVYRLFSPHPKSKLVSIPIYDLKKRTFCEKYLEYDNIKKDAKIEKVIEKFDNNETHLFEQKPNKITREHLKTLLRPDKLFPAFALLLRFGTIYSIKRTPQSFKFWYRFYELKCFYNYIETLVFNYKDENLNMMFSYIGNMASRLKIKNKNRIMSLLRLHLQYKKISFALFKHKLNSLYYVEFFFSLKSIVFLNDNEECLIQLFKNEFEFNNFLNQAEQIFDIAIDTVINRIVLKNIPKLSQNQIRAVNNYYKKSLYLINKADLFLKELKEGSNTGDKEVKLIKIIYFVSKIYFSSIKFVKDFFKKIKKEGEL